MNKKPFENRLLEILGGDLAAFDFCINIGFVSEVFDDIYDGDYSQKSTIEDALQAVLRLPSNPFYRANFDYLQPLIDMAMIHWIASNKLETVNIERAHFFRYLGVQIWIGAAVIKRGRKFANDHTNEIWEMSSMETLREFVDEINSMV